MTKNDVRIGESYLAKVSNQVVTVRIDSVHPRGGWEATNLTTHKKVRIKSAQRLRGPAPTRGGSPRATASEPAPRTDRCSTPRCRGEVAVTHLGRPLCQSCWDRQCAEAQREASAEGASEAAAESEAVVAVAAHSVPKPTAAKKSSGLDAAVEVLKQAGEPMRCRALVQTMLERGLWSTGGKTPQSTIYAAIVREIAEKGAAARFRKLERGLFTVNAA